MDQHVHQVITNGLRERGVDVLTAFEDESSELADAALLARATELGRVLFTQDKDFLAIARTHQIRGVPFIRCQARRSRSGGVPPFSKPDISRLASRTARMGAR
jgi:predicted nuclease of predicted toxin-antitoxin system